MREIRGARSDLDAVSRELHSLTTVLEMLAHDAGDTARSAFPPSLAHQVTGIVKNCGGVVSQIEASLEKHGGESTRLKKGVQWSWGGKSDMEQLRSSLEAHKSALDIALQMVEMSIMRDIKANTQEIRDDTAEIPGIKEDTTQILAEIAQLQAKLPKNVELQVLEGHGSSGFMLQRYLDNLTTYAETAYDASDGELEEETAPSMPRTVAEQEEIEHHLEHLNLSQDNTQELPKNITDGRFKDPDKESSLVYTISKTAGTIIEDASVSVDSSFNSPKSSLAGISESESHGSKKRNFSEAPKDLHDAANNRVEVNHLAIAKVFDRRSELSLEEYESLTRELVKTSLRQRIHFEMIGGRTMDLLRRGANPNGLESSPYRTIQNTPIGTAAKNTRFLAVLLKYGVDISVEMKADPPLEGQITALGIAAQNGNLKAVKMLLLAGANVNGPEHGISPIHAILSAPPIADNHIKILRLLAAHGANVNETGGRWFTALQFVCSVPEALVTTYLIKLVVEQLLSCGAKPNIRGGPYGSAIHAAVTVLNFNAVQLLLQHGADPGLRATYTFNRPDSGLRILRSFFSFHPVRREEVTPLELLDKLSFEYLKDSRSRKLKIRTLLEDYQSLIIKQCVNVLK